MIFTIKKLVLRTIPYMKIQYSIKSDGENMFILLKELKVKKKKKYISDIVFTGFSRRAAKRKFIWRLKHHDRDLREINRGPTKSFMVEPPLTVIAQY